MEEMGRLPFPGPYFSSAVLATLAARAVGAERPARAAGVGRAAGHGRARGVGSRLTRSTGCAPAPAARAPPGCSPARSRSCSTATPPTGSIVVARTEDGLGIVPAPGAVAASWCRRSIRRARRRASCSTRRRSSRVGPLGDHTASWRRVVDDGATMLCRGARRRVRGRAASSPSSTRRSASSSTGRSRRSRPSGTRPSTCCTASSSRGSGTHYAAWASDVDDPARERGRRDGEGLRRRGGGVRDGRGHPDPRRGRLHVGLRRALLLQAREAERRDARLPGLAAAAPRRPRPRIRRRSPACATARRLRDAVAEHVRAGDALHLVVGHTRWTAAAREVVRQWWGRDPGFTLVMLSLSSLGALFFQGGLVRKVDHRLLGRHVPELHAEPELRACVPGRRGRGRALVVPRVLAAARGGGAGAAGGDDAVDRRVVDGGERRVRAGRHAVR